MPIPQVNKKTTSKATGHKAGGSVRSKPKMHGTLASRRAKSTQGKDTKAKKSTRKQRFKRLCIRMALVAIVCGVVSIGAAFAWVSKDLASVEDIESRVVNQSTRIYARDGETLLYEIGDNRRQDVELDQIDDKIQWATIALEDQSFYQHRGFSVKSVVRASLKGILPGEQARGTSTLTQQFIKNAILTNERTYTRKIKELILAIRLEGKYSKDEILNFYLNEVYYGGNFQGVEVAAQEYFHKPASQVSLSEAATLASLPQNPVVLPNDPERLQIRRDHTLAQMAATGFITQAEAAAAIAEAVPDLSSTVTNINAPHFVFYVREYLEKTYGQTTIRRGGYKVITTLDWDKQQKAEQAVRDGMAKVEQYGGSNAALVSLDAHTGQILALVGSHDYFDDEHDGQVNIATSVRQPGSSFKPVVYLTGFDRGYTPDTKVYDVETDFPTEAEGLYHPRNYSLNEHGPISLRSALGQSLNIPAVKLLYLVGVDNVLNMAEKLGYTSLGDRSRFGLSLVLGGAEVSLLEHTHAYATFAREGERHAIGSILRVEDNSGNVVEEWSDAPEQVVTAESVRTLNSVLSDSNARAGFFRLNLSDRPSAAKTGTTNDFRDAWSMGYTPSISTGVWTGNNDNSPMSAGADGSVIAAPIWNQYMTAVLTGTPVETFNTQTQAAKTAVLGGEIETTSNKTVDRITGELIPDNCIATYPSDYIGHKDFKETHTILHYLRKEDPTGAGPINPRDDPMYEAWETAVVKWTKADERKNDYLTDETPKVDCNLRAADQQPKVTVRLNAGETYTPTTLALQARVVPASGRTIQTIEYLVDVVTVDRVSDLGIQTATTVTSNYDAKNLTSGNHTVTIRVTDNIGNSAEASVDIAYKTKK